VNRIEKNYNENRQKTYKKLIKRNVIERDNYITSLNKYIERQKELSESKKEKAFKKYQSYVSINIDYILIIHIFYNSILQ
jgi:hypothetical protein